MTSNELTIAVVGAGGKMGMRVSKNLQLTHHSVYYSDNSLAGQERTRAAGREVTDTATAVADADVVILAVPDHILGAVSGDVVSRLKAGAIVLTLDPAAAYAGLLAERAEVAFAVAHPCHPSVFLERTSKREWADTFGGIATPQDIAAALETGSDEQRAVTETVIRAMYAPVLDVHWVTVMQLAVLEPTLVETVACMIGALLNEALHETVYGVGVPEPAAKAMLYGHVQVALANGLRGDHPFSEACLIAMDYGRATLIKDDWKRIFDDSELDANIANMLRLNPAHVCPAS